VGEIVEPTSLEPWRPKRDWLAVVTMGRGRPTMTPVKRFRCPVEGARSITYPTRNGAGPGQRREREGAHISRIWVRDYQRGRIDAVDDDPGEQTDQAGWSELRERHDAEQHVRRVVELQHQPRACAALCIQVPRERGELTEEVETVVAMPQCAKRSGVARREGSLGGWSWSG